jgi:hypothetical protein
LYFIHVYTLFALYSSSYPFPCHLVHLFQSSSLLPSLFHMETLASLRLLYSFLYSEHIKLIQVFGLLPLPYPSSSWLSLSVTHVP